MYIKTLSTRNEARGSASDVDVGWERSYPCTTAKYPFPRQPGCDELHEVTSVTMEPKQVPRLKQSHEAITILLPILL